MKSVSRASAGTLVLGLTLALVIYQPWRTLPFDILDFSEFLPLLKREQSLSRRLIALMAYYTEEHGRFNVLPYAMLALKWTIFQDNTVLWQLLRFIQMSLIVLGVFILLIKLGVASYAAAVASLLFITAGTASPGWIRLTMAEPLGTVLFVGAAFLACGFAEAHDWKRRGTLIVGLLVACLWTKEMLVGVVPFIVLLALRGSLQRFRDRTRLTRQGRWLVCASLVGVVIATLPIVLLALTAPAQGFTSLYGQAPGGLSVFALNLALFGLPASPILFPQNLPNFLLTNYLYVALVVLGHWQLARSTGPDRTWLMMSGVALTLPLAAAVLYLPWPQVQPFYGLPYLLGASILLGQALTALENGPRLGAWIGRVASAMIIVGTACTAQRLAVMSFAQRQQQFDIARFLSGSPPEDSLLFAVRKSAPAAWEGTGPTLARYTAAVFEEPRPRAAADILCSEADDLITNPRPNILLISVSYECGPLARSSQVLRKRYDYVTWPAVGSRQDSLRADLWCSSALP